LLAFGFSREAAITVSASTGWTAIVNSGRIALFARVSDGGANDSLSLTFTGSTSACAVVSRWSGGNTNLGSLLNLSANWSTFFAAETSPNGNIWCAGITPSVNNCLVIRGGLTSNDDGTWTTAPAGDTMLSEYQYNAVGSDMSAAVCYRIQTTASAVAAGDITNGGASNDGYTFAAALTEGALSKFLKALTHPSAANATGVEVVVHSAPGGSNYITGTTRYGSANGKAFESATEGTGDAERAVLKVPAADVGCSGLAVDTVVAVCARNATLTTGVIPGTIIEE
jgi:hypothetical protein